MARWLLWLGIWFLVLNPYGYASEKKLYKWRDANGNLVYSDKPRPGAEEVKLKEVPTINLQAPKLGDIIEEREALIRQQHAQRPVIAFQYQSLSFVSPEEKGVLRNNAALIELQAKVEPALQKGHKIRFYLDGVAVGEASPELTVKIENAEYGPHQAYFEVLDEQGQIVQKSETVNFALLHVVRKKQGNNN